MKRGSNDSKFKAMVVNMAYVKGSVTEAAQELGISTSLLGKWRKTLKQDEPIERAGTTLTEEQKQIKWLQWELRESNLGRDILKKVVSIFSKGDGKYSGL